MTSLKASRLQKRRFQHMKLN